MAALECCLTGGHVKSGKSQGDLNRRISGNLGLLLNLRSYKVREKSGRFEWGDRCQPWTAA